MNNVNNNNNKKKKSIRCVVVQFLPDLPNSRKKKQTKNIYIYIKTTIHPRSIKTCKKKGKGYLRACPLARSREYQKKSKWKMRAHARTC